MRRRNAEIDGPPNPAGYDRRSSRSPPAACTSAARSATSTPPQRFICPCHGGVYDFPGKVVGGPPVRPLDRFYTRVRADAWRSARATRSTPSSSASTLPRPGAGPRRHRPVPLPAGLRPDAEARLTVMKLPKQAPPCDSPSPPPAPSARRARRGRGPGPPTRPRRPGSTRRLDRRAHLAVRRRRWADVPQGPEGDELVLHAGLGDDVRLPLPGGHRRLPGHVLRPVADARLRVGPLHHQRGLPRRVRARHAQVGLDA